MGNPLITHILKDFISDRDSGEEEKHQIDELQSIIFSNQTVFEQNQANVKKVKKLKDLPQRLQQLQD